MRTGRPSDPDAPLRMYAHRVGKYTYAATQGSDTDQDGQRKRGFHHNPQDKTVEAFERRDKKYLKAKENCGFFAFLTLGLDWSAAETLRAYRLRDVQEKYFTSMKTRLRAERAPLHAAKLDHPA